MDYVEWCDTVADGLADYVERQSSRSFHLHPFASDFISTHPGPDWGLVVTTASELMRDVGLSDQGTSYRLKTQDLEVLRDHYSRWQEASSVRLTSVELTVLAGVRDLSERRYPTYAEVIDVRSADIFELAAERCSDFPARLDDRFDLLEALAGLSLLVLKKYGDGWLCKPTYAGAARLIKSHVATDAFINDLRTRGEGGGLDYKRSYDLDDKRKDKRFDLAKDIVSLANAAGTETCLILVGVEDDGTFFVPKSPEEDKAHRAALSALADERIQEIVSSRTIPTPSVRVAYRGEHKDGPYAVLSIERDVANLPYRVFKLPNDRKALEALQLGQVWIRKGSTNAEATTAEIDELQRRAALYASIRASA